MLMVVYKLIKLLSFGELTLISKKQYQYLFYGRKLEIILCLL